MRRAARLCAYSENPFQLGARSHLNQRGRKSNYPFDAGICSANRSTSETALTPFQWLYEKKTALPLTNKEWEADITLPSIVGSATDAIGARVIHGVRSDPATWNTAGSVVNERTSG